MIAQDLCDFLNKMLADDPDFVNSLFFNRVKVENQNAHVFVALDQSASIIGLINGFLDTQNENVIAMVTSPPKGRIDKFLVVEKEVFLKQDENNKS